MQSFGENELDRESAGSESSIENDPEGNPDEREEAEADAEATGDMDGENEEENAEEEDTSNYSTQATKPAQPAPTSAPNPSVLLTSPSSTQDSSASNVAVNDSLKVRQEAITADVYDVVPTIAAPHSTSINAIAATPDLRWVFSGGADGYIRKFNWIETANGRSMLTVAQRHPFVDSVTKAGCLMNYWENNEDSTGTYSARIQKYGKKH